MACPPHTVRRTAQRWVAWVMACVVLLPALAACGSESQPDPNAGTQIQWTAGLPAAGAPAAQPTAAPAADAGAAAAPTTPAGAVAVQPTAAAPTGGAPLTAAQLAEIQPNELGMIPIVEYHQFTTNPDEKAQFVRTIDDFRSDLQWFYEHDFYVVPLKSIIENRIAAPAGKHPMAITFDDSQAGQFRYLIAADGSVTIDPDSAMGVMEEFYAAHPDFGRGGFFGVLPYACFDWNASASEPEQSQFCKQKIDFLLANGYEVGNHTLNHTSIQSIDNDTFRAEIGGAVLALQGYNPAVEANIFVVPFGMYPAYDTPEGQQQREWMQNGFEYDGQSFLLIGSLMVGAEWAPSPASLNWDSLWIPRIQACDCEELGGGGYDTWLPTFEALEYLLYTSDGNPATVTVPYDLPAEIDGTLDETRLNGSELIRY
jgi:peptidoglycan/xylan/chitin deacetylase (PgdA/CDA1 family)